MGWINKHFNRLDVQGTGTVSINNQSEAYNNTGCACRNKRQFDEALLNFNKAIILDPKFAEGY